MAGKKDPDVDGGFAWAILAGCFFMFMLVSGNIKSYGILYTSMLKYYDAGSGNTAWIGSSCLLLMLGLSPIANLLSKRFTFRVVAFVGGVLLCTGFTISAFVPSISYLYVTLGVLCGLGYGLSFSPCSTIISFYFEKHRALANGITVSASGIGVLFFPFFYRYLVTEFTLSGTFLIVGGFILNVCAAACIFRQPKLLEEMRLKELREKHRKCDEKRSMNGENSRIQEDEDTGEKKSCDLDFLKLSLFKNPRFTLYIISFVLCMNAHANNLILIPSHVALLGYDEFKVALSISIMGGSEVISRIAFGWIADKDFIKRSNIFILNMGIGSVVAFLAPFEPFQNFTYMAIYSAIIGIFPGSFLSLTSVLIIDVVGMKDFTAAFGLSSFSLAIGVSFSQPSIGWLMDYYGNWNMSFVVTGVLLLSSALLMALEPLLIRLFRKQEDFNATGLDKNEIDEMPLRIRHKSSPPVADDTGSLLDEDVDVSVTSSRISRIYRPIKADSPPKSPDRTSAPIVASSED